jgi:hypothetical protein
MVSCPERRKGKYSDLSVRERDTDMNWEKNKIIKIGTE